MSLRKEIWLELKKVFYNALSILLTVLGSFLLIGVITFILDKEIIASVIFLIFTCLCYFLSLFFNKKRTDENPQISLWLLTLIFLSVVFVILGGISSNSNLLHSDNKNINAFVNDIYNELNDSKLELEGLEYKKFEDGYYPVVTYHHELYDSLSFKFDNDGNFLGLTVKAKKSDLLLPALQMIGLSTFNFTLQDKTQIGEILTHDKETKKEVFGEYYIIYFPSLGYFCIVKEK